MLTSVRRRRDLGFRSGEVYEGFAEKPRFCSLQPAARRKQSRFANGLAAMRPRIRIYGRPRLSRVRGSVCGASESGLLNGLRGIKSNPNVPGVVRGQSRQATLRRAPGNGRNRDVLRTSQAAAMDDAVGRSSPVQIRGNTGASSEIGIEASVTAHEALVDKSINRAQSIFQLPTPLRQLGRDERPSKRTHPLVDHRTQCPTIDRAVRK
jgi:hypothetical protein